MKKRFWVSYLLISAFLATFIGVFNLEQRASAINYNTGSVDHSNYSIKCDTAKKSLYSDATSSSRYGDVMESKQTNVYPIFGKTITEINNELGQCAPDMANDNDSFTGQSKYSLNVNYGWTDNGGSCTITNTAVNLSIVTIIPSWQNSSTAALQLKQAWQNYSTGLTAHENGHAQIDETYARQLSSSLKSIRVTDCASLKAQVNALLGQTTQKINAANQAYDAATDHGAEQGAVLKLS